jgi:hypothetical protein
MKSARFAAVPLVLAAAALSSCSSKDSTGPANNLGNITCSAADQAVCPPSSLRLGFNGSAGTPTITPSDPSTSFSVSVAGYAVGGATNSTLNGYWFIVIGGTLRAWGVITVANGIYAAQVPLFCGRQAILYRFDNATGSSFWYAGATLTGCTRADFRVQLTWDTNTNDSINSDIDLHLVRPGGTTNSTTNDCFFFDCTPSDPSLDWGASGASGNPLLDVDNIVGYGPENITLSNAESGTYRVIVHNYSGVWATHATVKIYFNDVEAYRNTSLALDYPSNEYWSVANVDILNHTVTPVDTYSATAPAAPGVRPLAGRVRK